MIKAKFFKKGERLVGFLISGHAGAGTYGNDIVCAGVSSAVMLTVNTVTDFTTADASVKVLENKVGLRLNNPEKDAEAEMLLESLLEHLAALAQTQGRIQVSVIEL